jgi:glutathione S-transferase
MLLSFLELPYEEITVDLMSGAHKQPDFLKLNPRGQIPVLVDDDVTLYDSHAIITYLARKYARMDLLPDEAESLGRVTQWLSFSANEVQAGPFLLRLHYLLDTPIDVDAVRQQAEATLQLLDDHLANREWLELGRFTLADLACFPYVAVAHEGKVNMDAYPNIADWMGRIKALPGFVAMPGM